MEDSVNKTKIKKSDFIQGVVLATIGATIGMTLGNVASDRINEKRDLKKVVSDSEVIYNQDNNDVYELKCIFEPGQHQISYCYLRTIDSLGVLDIQIPEGYEIVANDVKKLRVNGNQYYQIIVKYQNVTTVVANGVYDPKNNMIEYLEAGTPTDTMQLKLN